MNKEFDPKLKDILLRLNIGNEEFFEYITSRVVNLPLKAQDFPWGVYPTYNLSKVLVNIKILVPSVVDEATLLANIHEFTRAYYLYLHLNEMFEPNEDLAKRLVRSKEIKYLKLIKKNID